MNLTGMHCDDRRLLLRQATADNHRSVEDAAGDTATEVGYRHYIAGLFAFRAPVEAALRACAWPQALGPWRPLLISEPLMLDLADLEQARPEIDPAPRVSNNISDLLGLLYVLEGSSLGARVIFRQVRELGYHDNFGARHLSAQTGATQNWKAFLTLLKHAPGFDLDRAVRAANATFLGAANAFRRARAVRT